MGIDQKKHWRHWHDVIFKPSLKERRKTDLKQNYSQQVVTALSNDASKQKPEQNVLDLESSAHR